MSLLNSILENMADENVVQLFTDPSCEMAKVIFNDVCVYEGNYWDFHPGCYGDDEFAKQTGWSGNRPPSLVSAIEVFVIKSGKKIHRLETSKYIYE